VKAFKRYQGFSPRCGDVSTLDDIEQAITEFSPRTWRCFQLRR